MSEQLNPLFQPLVFKKGIALKNRVVMAPMTTWASNEDYTISDDEVKHYRARVKGVGLVITGCSRVTPNGIGFTHEFASYDDTSLPSLKNWLRQQKAMAPRPFCKSIMPAIKLLRN